MKERNAMASWIVPTLAYVVLVGAAGVTTKLALRTISWEQLVLWVPIVYVVIAAVLVATRGARFPLGVGGAWAAVTAICMALALIVLFYALTQADASRVVPASSAYPAVTLIGAALFLGESITLTRVVGTALVIAGVVLISR
jgi:bacterial/archaeal transporter family protein